MQMCWAYTINLALIAFRYFVAILMAFDPFIITWLLLTIMFILDVTICFVEYGTH